MIVVFQAGPSEFIFVPIKKIRKIFEVKIAIMKESTEPEILKNKNASSLEGHDARIRLLWSLDVWMISACLFIASSESFYSHKCLQHFVLLQLVMILLTFKMRSVVFFLRMKKTAPCARKVSCNCGVTSHLKDMLVYSRFCPCES